MRIETKVFYYSVWQIVSTLVLLCFSLYRSYTRSKSGNTNFDYLFFSYPFAIVAGVEGILSSRNPTPSNARRHYYELLVAHVMATFVYAVLCIIGDELYEEFLTGLEFQIFAGVMAAYYVVTGLWFRSIAVEYLIWIQSAELAVLAKPSPIF
mmetsp:Transcript_8392/g.9549  ORF Transcript_8392/g.9549 Transcript_8392/m.9549 type:complete len:152 (+) Transcript_8392:85-540(+)